MRTSAADGRLTGASPSQFGEIDADWDRADRSVKRSARVIPLWSNPTHPNDHLPKCELSLAVWLHRRQHHCSTRMTDLRPRLRTSGTGMPTIKSEREHTFTFGGFERYELDHASAAHLTMLLCFPHCCRAVGMETAKAYYPGSFRKEECCSMRVHLDRKPLDGVAIAFVVISLLTVVALAILLSRLNTLF
jgi:hypothetical protein